MLGLKVYVTQNESLKSKVSSRGTWERNPYCFCYEFELVK